MCKNKKKKRFKSRNSVIVFALIKYETRKRKDPLRKKKKITGEVLFAICFKAVEHDWKDSLG